MARHVLKGLARPKAAGSVSPDLKASGFVSPDLEAAGSVSPDPKYTGSVSSKATGSVLPDL